HRRPLLLPLFELVLELLLLVLGHQPVALYFGRRTLFLLRLLPRLAPDRLLLVRARRHVGAARRRRLLLLLFGLALEHLLLVLGQEPKRVLWGRRTGRLVRRPRTSARAAERRVRSRRSAVHSGRRE